MGDPIDFTLGLLDDEFKGMTGYVIVGGGRLPVVDEMKATAFYRL